MRCQATAIAGGEHSVFFMVQSGNRLLKNREVSLSHTVQHPIMRDNLVSKLQSSILLGSLSLIPNHTLRYKLLAIVACLALLYVIHLKRPSTQLSQLEDMVNKTEEIIRDAKSYCPRDLLRLAEEGVKRSASMIHCRMLEVDTLTWKKYCVLSRDIAECAKTVKNVGTAVQLIVEAERQHKYMDDINQTETILTYVHSPARSFNLLPDSQSSEACFNPAFLICNSNPPGSV
ncbi:hypothetical protein C8R44DRAFT_900223 [Mycena epipterygia]|nr:hypothetical protein C8R44DRAFT_900223 [Mycena epipterygia]